MEKRVAVFARAVSIIGTGALFGGITAVLTASILSAVLMGVLGSLTEWFTGKYDPARRS